jgi:hypothetical protein
MATEIDILQLPTAEVIQAAQTAAVDAAAGAETALDEDGKLKVSAIPEYLEEASLSNTIEAEAARLIEPVETAVAGKADTSAVTAALLPKLDKSEAASTYATPAQAATAGAEAGSAAAVSTLAGQPSVTDAAAAAVGAAATGLSLVKTTDPGVPLTRAAVSVLGGGLEEVTRRGSDDGFLEGRRGGTKVFPAVEILGGGTNVNVPLANTSKATVLGARAYNGDESYGEDRLDKAGRVPKETIARWLARAGFTGGAGSPWKGKTILVLGTSITARPGGFADQLSTLLGATILNRAVGSSGIVWDRTVENRFRSLSATVAELDAAYGVGTWSDQSYEQRVIPYINGVLGRADAVLVDHNYNDGLYALGTIDSTDKATFYGAMNHVLGAIIAARPDIAIFLQTAPSLFTPLGGGYNTGTADKRSAILALGVRWGLPVFDMTAVSHLGAAQAAHWISDTVHPDTPWHTNIAAPRLAAWFNQNPVIGQTS